MKGKTTYDFKIKLKNRKYKNEFKILKIIIVIQDT